MAPAVRDASDDRLIPYYYSIAYSGLFLPKVSGHIPQLKKTHIRIVPHHRIALLNHHAEIAGIAKDAFDVRAGILPGTLDITVVKGLKLAANDILDRVRILCRCGRDKYPKPKNQSK